jgi:hypothetical protein
MRHPVALAVALVATLAISAADAPAPVYATDPQNLVVHEWGTFTSVAGRSGEAESWLPLSGDDDLPCFVDRIELGVKPNLSGTVRMETPVLYFYAREQMTVDVGVKFAQGAITEWYPRATITPARLDLTTNLAQLESTARWARVLIRPGAVANYPNEPEASHYYAARATDATPIQVDGEDEKFLFYRGVGAFQPPLSAALTANGRVRVESRTKNEIGEVVQFDNTDGRVRFRFATSNSSRMTLDATLPKGDIADLYARLERLLVARGLYAREARAMIETWKDSWFEPGTRLIYIAPSAFVDAILPLDIQPRPAAIARVFVGRIELLSDAKLAAVKNALLTEDEPALTAHGRFLWPAVQRVLADANAADRARLDRSLGVVYRMPTHNLRNCVRRD